MHRRQCENTLETYVTPVFGNKPVASIGREHVLEVLQPLWLTKTEPASRLRGRIERILDCARVQGWREAENPARWRGHLDQILPKLADFMVKLREQGTTAALALTSWFVEQAKADSTIKSVPYFRYWLAARRSSPGGAGADRR